MSRPTLALIPTAFKAGKLYSVLPSDGSGDFDVSRNGAATYLGQDGLIKTALANEPRFEYNPDVSFKGVLVEPVSTNLIPTSDSGVGGGSGTTDINNAELVISPRNILEGYYITPTMVSSRFEFSITNTNTIFTYSWYAKRFSIPLESEQIGDVGFNVPINCDITDVKQIETLNNGWNRFSATVTKIDNNITAILRAYFGYIIGIGNKSVAYFGHQLEVGTVATSYIPTLDSQVTRPTDLITVVVPLNSTQVSYILDDIVVIESVVGGSTFTLPNGHISQLTMN